MVLNINPGRDMYYDHDDKHLSGSQFLGIRVAAQKLFGCHRSDLAEILTPEEEQVFLLDR